MGPSPHPSSSSSHFSHILPSSSPSSVQPPSFSRVGDWFLSTSERDTHTLTQALSHELSSKGGPSAPFSSSSSSSSSPTANSASCSFSSFSESLTRSTLEGRGFLQSSAGLSVVRAMQQPQHQQKQAAVMFSRRLQQDGFLDTEQKSLQKGSPFSSNSPSTKERPESPFSTSTLSTNSTISMPNRESLLAHLKPNNQDVQGGIFASTNASHNSASEISNLYKISSSTASIALSSQASMGAMDGKVIKRKSRASSKSPIAVISADASNFRAMVQHLTGIPSSPSIHVYGSSGIPVLKPQPMRHLYTNTVPTLDTSTSLLGPNPMMKSTLQGYPFIQRYDQVSSSPLSAINLTRGQEPRQISTSPLSAIDLTRAQGRNVGSMLQSNLQKQFTIGHDHGNPIDYGLSSSSLAQTFQSPLDSSHSGKRRESLGQFPLRQAPQMENPPTKSPYNSVDAWLSSDGALANHTFSMELGRMA